MPDQSSKNTRVMCWMCLKIEIKSNGNGSVSGVFIVYFEDIQHIIWDWTLNLKDTTSFTPIWSEGKLSFSTEIGAFFWKSTDNLEIVTWTSVGEWLLLDRFPLCKSSSFFKEFLLLELYVRKMYGFSSSL